MKDAKGHGSNARGGVQARLAAARTNPNHPLGALTRAVSQGTPIAGVPAHQAGVVAATESAQSHDLRLFGDNDGNLYRQSFQPVVSNLSKKMDKGVYDSAKATKLWGYHADRAAQSMAKQSGDSRAWHQQFPTSVRKEAAGHWERQNAGRIKRGEFK